VAGSLTILTKPRLWLSIRAFGDAEKGTFVTRTFRPSEKASASASPTSAI
jgi:hypothetical protein